MQVLASLIFVCYYAVVGEKLPLVKGSAEKIENLPFQAQITKNEYPICGGTLVSSLHVLTAAHCVYDIVQRFPHVYFKNIRVLVGSSFHGQGWSYGVRRVSHHRDYVDARINTPYFIPNDVAVIQLARPVAFGPTVQPINLPAVAYSEVADGTPVIVSGFGSSRYRARPSMVLKQMLTYVMPRDACQARYRKIILSSHLCTHRIPINRAAEFYDGTCSGDSGGPLVTADKKVIIGIVSGGYGGCESSYPNVFAKVSHYLQYIRSEMGYYTQHPYWRSIHPSVGDMTAN
ncbi:vitellin-degrading protease-like [Trichogramma pretiosum]|uniref:vitellin-degrading protease-like n=1 Tax=Trichogramma pretiosum TaxID=7493 RepID=UPI000C719AC2|nr:vitellin-degrading protease-like [Trichogramma pretiosum]